MDPAGRVNRAAITFFRCAGRRKPSLALSFAGFSVFVCLLATALCVIDVMHARRVAVEVARREAENLAQSLAQQASDTFDAADGALRTLAEMVERNGTKPAERKSLQDTLDALIATMPRINNLAIADERGQLVVSKLSAPDGRMPTVADRAYYRYHRARPGSAIFVSGPAISKVDGSWVLFATRRLDRPDGRFAGVAIAPISLTYFDRSFAAVDIGRLGSISMITDDGTLAVRRPRTSIGAQFRDDDVFGDRFKNFMSGSYIGVSPVDGTRRLFAFVRLPRYPLVLKVGLAEREYLAAWRADALANYLALAAGTALIGTLASGLGGQITRRKVAESALARSSTDALTGLANRRRFDGELEREWRRAAVDRSAIGLLLIDVENLAAYNERHGREDGDNLLIAIAGAISASIDPPDELAARYSGLQFAVLLPMTDAADATGVARRIHFAFARQVVQPSGAPDETVALRIRAAGLIPQEDDGPATLIAAATAAHQMIERGQDMV